MSEWSLFHLAGVFTNFHQDADGVGVVGQVAGDRQKAVPKLWGVVSFKPGISLRPQDKAQLAKIVGEICAIKEKNGFFDELSGKLRQGKVFVWADPSFSDYCVVEIMYILPGDIL